MLPLAHRRLAPLALVFVLTACADERDGALPRRDAGAVDGGRADDATADDAEPTRDGGVTPDAAHDAGVDAGVEGDAGLDPATCPVGPADGCCPLLRYGGTDPDCPSLACPALEVSPAIVLEGTPGVAGEGSAPMVWDGRELVIARVQTATVGQGVLLFVERRDYDGNRVLGPVARPVDGAANQTRGLATMTFDAARRRFLFAHGGANGVSLVAFDEDGTIVAQQSSGLSICSVIDATFAVWSTGSDFLLTGTSYTCAGSTGRTMLTRVALDGTVGRTHELGDGARPELSWESSAACDLGCQRVLSVWNRGYEGSWRARTFDVAADAPGTAVDLQANLQSYVDHSGVASDGSDFFVYSALQTDVAGATRRSFRRWRPGAGWLDDGYTISGRRGLAPSVIWTGDGWLVAVASYTYSTSYAFPTDRDAYDLELYHFAPDGAFRERLAPEPTPSLHPTLAWAGGRVALTYVRVAPGQPEEHVLRYLDCPVD
ncbi:hypothetical protein L6R52_43500 [Myxococcota bacterium]|nr:hypothetical protein [Myxococcota bacterium]